MADKILMLALSPTMENGTIAKWVKHEGDTVAIGDVLCEVETDKTTMELESPAAGVLLRIAVGEGEDAEVGDTIGFIGDAGEKVDTPHETESATEQHTAGDTRPKDDDSSSPDSSAGDAGEPSLSQPPADAEPGASEPDSWVRASPLARRLARQAGIDLHSLEGSGPRGRVIKRDIEAAQSGAAKQTEAADTQSVSETVEIVPVSRRRKVIAQRLTESKFTAPHYYLKAHVRVGRLLEARTRANEGRPGDRRLSLNAFLIKLVAQVLVRHPQVHSSWDGDSIRRFRDADIGLAVALDDGLVTPIIRGCQKRGIESIDEELGELIDAARDDKLRPEQYTGATFTVSNLGSFGVDEFTAIVNPPGAAILAVGAIRTEAEFRADGEVIPVEKMTLTLSCDHRVIDGAVGAAFMRDLRLAIEEPGLALL